MRKVICTISSKNYIQYTQRLCGSLRGCGWRDEIVVLSPDRVYCNEQVKVVNLRLKSTVPTLMDPRWLQFELEQYFNPGDRVCYLDSDMLCMPKCDFKKLFSGDRIVMPTLGWELDTTGELPLLSSLVKYAVTSKYIESPFAFTVGDETASRIFAKAREVIPIANKNRRGTIFCFNLAIHKLKLKPQDFVLLPDYTVYYAVDDAHGRQIDENVNWFIHYGGRVGKKLWRKHFEQGYGNV
jgi:hypothetical protein